MQINKLNLFEEKLQLQEDFKNMFPVDLVSVPAFKLSAAVKFWNNK